MDYRGDPCLDYVDFLVGGPEHPFLLLLPVVLLYRRIFLTTVPRIVICVTYIYITMRCWRCHLCRLCGAGQRTQTVRTMGQTVTNNLFGFLFPLRVIE